MGVLESLVKWIYIPPAPYCVSSVSKFTSTAHREKRLGDFKKGGQDLVCVITAESTPSCILQTHTTCLTTGTILRKLGWPNSPGLWFCDGVGSLEYAEEGQKCLAWHPQVSTRLMPGLRLSKWRLGSLPTYTVVFQTYRAPVYQLHSTAIWASFFF